jgi:hypothetical protein
MCSLSELSFVLRTGQLEERVMALMDEAVWRGKIYSGGWVGGGAAMPQLSSPLRRDR